LGGQFLFNSFQVWAAPNKGVASHVAALPPK